MLDVLACACVCFFSISVRFKQCARTISFLFTYKIRLFIQRLGVVHFFIPFTGSAGSKKREYNTRIYKNKKIV